MKYNKTFRSLAAFVLALMLMLTMSTLGVLAADDDAAAADGNSAVVDESESDKASDETVGEAEDADGAAGEDASDEDADDASDDDADDASDDTDSKKLGVGFWVSMGVLGVLIIVGVVFAIIKREKLKVWLKSYKSELKKIVWMPWSQVRKNTVVVIVVVVAVAAVIGLLDYAFSKGIIALGSLF